MLGQLVGRVYYIDSEPLYEKLVAAFVTSLMYCLKALDTLEEA